MDRTIIERNFMKKTILTAIAVMLLACNTALAQPADLRAQQQKVNNIKKTQQGKVIFRLVEKYSKQYKVDPAFAHSVILVESGYNPNAKSPCGAKGLFQMMDGTFYARKVGNNPYNIEQNIQAGIKHIAGLQAKYKGNMYAVASAYNIGGGAHDKLVAKYGTMPKVTKDYVYRVQSYKQLITF